MGKGISSVAGNSNVAGGPSVVKGRDWWWVGRWRTLAGEEGRGHWARCACAVRDHSYVTHEESVGIKLVLGKYYKLGSN